MWEISCKNSERLLRKWQKKLYGILFCRTLCMHLHSYLVNWNSKIWLFSLRSCRLNGTDVISKRKLEINQVVQTCANTVSDHPVLGISRNGFLNVTRAPITGFSRAVNFTANMQGPVRKWKEISRTGLLSKSNQSFLVLCKGYNHNNN